MPEKLRFGVLGCGDAARRLFIPGLKGCRRARLAAVAGRDVGKARSLALESACAHAPSYDELLDRDDVDVVYIALPIGLHAQWALKALDKGKHVYCEKSMAPALEDVERILRRAKERDRRVMEGFMYRFHSLFAAVRGIIASGELGRLRSFVGSFGFTLPAGDVARRNPGLAMGALNETGCYTVSAARNFYGGLPRIVCARLERQDGLDTSGSAYLRFADGDAYCEFGYDRSYRCCYSLWGAEGHLSVERAFSTPPTLEPAVCVSKAGGQEVRRLGAENHFSKAIDAFCEAIETKTGYDMFEGDAHDQAVVMEALRVSAREKTVVDTAVLRRLS